MLVVAHMLLSLLPFFAAFLVQAHVAQQFASNSENDGASTCDAETPMQKRMEEGDFYRTHVEERNLPLVDISLAKFEDRVERYSHTNNLAKYEKNKKLKKLVKKGNSERLYAQAAKYGLEHQALVKQIGKLTAKAEKTSKKEVAFGILAERLDEDYAPTYDAFLQSLIGTSYSQELLRQMQRNTPPDWDEKTILKKLDAYLKRHRSMTNEDDDGQSSTTPDPTKLSRQESLLRQKQHEAAALSGLSPHYFDLFINNEKLRKLELKMPTASPEAYERCLIRWHRLKAIKAAVLVDDARAARDVCLRYHLDRYALEQQLSPLQAKEAKTRAKEIAWTKKADSVARKESMENMNLNRSLGRLHM